MRKKPSNPFTPTFGKVPFALAGRTDYIDDVIGGLSNQPGDPYRTVIFFGPRGSGKTVLMETIAREAAGMGWVSASVVVRPNMLEELFWVLRSHAAHVIDNPPQSNIISLQAGPIGVSREIVHDDLPWHIRMGQLVEEINAHHTGVLFVIDEANPDSEEFRTFIGTYQSFVREDRDVALIIGGLPDKTSSLLVIENISFIRRAFQRPLKPIPIVEVEQALLETIEGNGRHIDQDALSLCAEATGGYAYAIQVVGYYLWRNTPEGRDFNAEDAERAIKLMIHEMERTVFVPTLRSLSLREEEYLYAMAQDEGPSSTSEVARRMGISMSNGANIRRRLIEQGIIAEVRMGTVEFDIPLLQDFLQSRL
ncbi:MAG: hypothetical protein Q4D27_09295 [Coriobacteriia bacterium]|nr:hypothetical protein [Coriobacteriia bacterium]